MEGLSLQTLDEVGDFIDRLTAALHQEIPGEHTVAVLASNGSTLIAKASSAIDENRMAELSALNELIGNQTLSYLGKETRIHVNNWTFSVYGRHPRDMINDVTLVNETIRHGFRTAVLQALQAALDSYSYFDLSDVT